MEIPEHDYGRLQEEIISVIENKNLVVLQKQVKKIIQFFETLEVRHGVMLVGPTGGGKTTIYEVIISLGCTLHIVERREIFGWEYLQNVKQFGFGSGPTFCDLGQTVCKENAFFVFVFLLLFLQRKCY